MKTATTTFVVFLLMACNTGPKAFDYGSDACHYCKMTIVEKPFACEIVTAKGKIFKYDAIECLVAHMQEDDQGKDFAVYVTDYANPGTLLEGPGAYYVKSPAIPSPMGENLSAHASKEAAETALGGSEGKVVDWAAVSAID